MRRTVHSDGVSKEGSTGYHRLVAEMFMHSSLLSLRMQPKERELVLSCAVGEHRVAPSLRSNLFSTVEIAQSGGQSRFRSTTYIYSRFSMIGMVSGIAPPCRSEIGGYVICYGFD